PVPPPVAPELAGVLVAVAPPQAARMATAPRPATPASPARSSARRLSGRAKGAASRGDSSRSPMIPVLPPGAPCGGLLLRSPRRPVYHSLRDTRTLAVAPARPRPRERYPSPAALAGGQRGRPPRSPPAKGEPRFATNRSSRGWGRGRKSCLTGSGRWQASGDRRRPVPLALLYHQA